MEQRGIYLSDDEKKLPQYNMETMESNINGLYLASVICGGMETHKWFIENSRVHAKMISAQGNDLKKYEESLGVFKSRLSSKNMIN